MKKFVNKKFNEALMWAGCEIREEHYDHVEAIFDDITPYGWECHTADAEEMADENEADVLKRRHGVPGKYPHKSGYGFCYNPAIIAD